MRYKPLKKTDPFPKTRVVKKDSKVKAPVVNGSADYYGANSLEHFSSASSLSLTHEDAQGFLDYPTSFPGKAANFWFKDAQVGVWEYEEAFDNWQDTYGMDACRVFYHSGHGAMDANGVFQAPLGSMWDGRDWAFSNNMAFGNEELRYLFWSTCFSLRVSGNDSPIRTWNIPNKGNLRMIFGYETTSIDDASYGSKFWEEWKKGKTFAQAFLDASWRISHDQVPVVMAVGSSQADAINRLNNERFFTAAGVTKAWYQWEWIGTLPGRSITPRTAVPKKANALILDSKQFTDERISKIAAQLGFTKTAAGTILFDEFGNKVISAANAQINVSSEGALNINLGKPNYENRRQIDLSKAAEIAKKTISSLGLDKNIELTTGNVRHHITGGGSLKEDGKLDESFVVSTIIQFRQAHNGIESVNSDHGLITVKVDNDGTVTNIYNSTKLVVGEAEKPRAVAIVPPQKASKEVISTDEQFNRKVETIMNAKLTKEVKAKTKAETLTEKVGYDFSGNNGAVVHQKIVEIQTDQFAKRYKLRVPVKG